MYESRVWETQGGLNYKEYEESIYSVTAGKGKSKVSRISHNENNKCFFLSPMTVPRQKAKSVCKKSRQNKINKQTTITTNRGYTFSGNNFPIGLFGLLLPQ